MMIKIPASRAPKRFDRPLLNKEGGKHYLDKPTLDALSEINISVAIVRGTVYLVQDKGENHRAMFALPPEKKLNEVIGLKTGIDIAPLIIKHREKSCFACNSLGQKCLAPEACGKPVVKVQNTAKTKDIK